MSKRGCYRYKWLGSEKADNALHAELLAVLAGEPRHIQALVFPLLPELSIQEDIVNILPDSPQSAAAVVLLGKSGMVKLLNEQCM